MELEEAIKKCKIIITTKFNNDYSIDSIDKEAIETVLQALEKLQKHCKEMIKEKQELTSVLLDSIPKKKIEELIIHLKLLKRHIALNDEQRKGFDVCIEEVQKLLEETDE